MKPKTKSPAGSGALHSANSPNWGTPPILRRFSAHVLAPAAMGRSIDLDYASSAYWQKWWEDADRPHNFLDGSKGRDVLKEADRRAVGGRLGSGFMNPPGLGGGGMVQQCWEIFETDHREAKLGSGVYQGFSVEQFGSLQNVGERNPLTTSPDDLITTIVPSRRTHYVVPPDDLVAIVRRKLKKRERGSKQWKAEKALIKKLLERKEDTPVDAGAPSHLSFTTILWHRDRAVRRTQMKLCRQFLEEQNQNPKALLYKFEAIGPLELT